MFENEFRAIIRNQKEGFSMTKSSQNAIDRISQSIRDAGYDPYSQLYGFLMTGNDRFVTRTGKARERIKLVDRAELACYLQRAV